ncbi:MAG: glycosyltransferase family 9 protein [Verrucomicrobiaceae bacterium]|nr:glycosyltransferase family 9 protein [Verrucomicrobiaceae bacterium]
MNLANNTMPGLARELSNARRLLVIKPSSLGDIVHALPAVAVIKSAMPELEIRWVANEEFVPLLEGNADLEEVIAFPRSRMRGPLSVLRFLGWSRTLSLPEPPDLVIDFQGLFRSGLMASRSGGAKVVGLSDGREFAGFFHHHRVEVDPDAHAVDRYLEVPCALGVEVPSEDTGLSFKLPLEKPESPPPEGFVLLHPFSRGAGKSLTVESVLAFCEAMGQCPVVLVGRGGPKLESLPGNVHNWMNATGLAQLAWLMENALFNVSVDSGPAHMAAALGENLLVIHGWSDPLKVGPYRKQAWVWKSGKFFRAGNADPAVARGQGKLPDIAQIKEIASQVREIAGLS